MIINRETLNKLLHEDILTITFTKKDGSERVMRCTLREDLLPNRPEPAGTVKKKQTNEDVIPVYDIKAKGFRSFRLDSLKRVEFSNSETE